MAANVRTNTPDATERAFFIAESPHWSRESPRGRASQMRTLPESQFAWGSTTRKLGRLALPHFAPQCPAAVQLLFMRVWRRLNVARGPSGRYNPRVGTRLVKSLEEIRHATPRRVRLESWKEIAAYLRRD